MNVKTRLARLESRIAGDTPARRGLAAVLTIIARRQDPDAPAVRVQDLPPEWRTLADLVRASYRPDGPAEQRPEGAA
jgi:hypothetical protein